MKLHGIFTSFLIIALSGLIFSGCNSGIENQATEETDALNKKESSGLVISNEALKNIDVRYSKADTITIASDLMAKGKVIVLPGNKSIVSSHIRGLVSDIYVSVGQSIKKGDVLCSLESFEFIEIQENYLIAKSNLNLLKENYNRQLELKAENITSKKILQEAEAMFNEASAKFQSLQAKLEILGVSPEDIVANGIQSDYKIKSPIDGMVDDIFTTVGSFISSNEFIVKILCNKKLLIELSVFEKDIPFVKVGQTVLFSIPNVGNKRYKAIITAISSEVREDLKTVKVTGNILETSDMIMPGMFIAGEIQSKENRILALPTEAIITVDKDIQYVFSAQKEGDTAVSFSKIPVQSGMSQNDLTEINFLGPIDPETLFVSKGSYYINAEMLKEED